MNIDKKKKVLIENGWAETYGENYGGMWYHKHSLNLYINVQIYRKINTGHRVAIGNMTIFLSELYWPDMSRKDKYETIVHECCHLIDAYERDIIKNPHGPTWFSLMERLGVNPEVGYSFQVSIQVINNGVA